MDAPSVPFVVMETASLMLRQYGADAYEKLRRSAAQLYAAGNTRAAEVVLATYVEARRRAVSDASGFAIRLFALPASLQMLSG